MRQPRLPPTALRFKRRLLAWYRRQARDLPWRRTRDAYHVVVSEFMLQQTQVSRVEEFYPRFLKRYPTIEHLARAKPKAVRESWDGLGYYRRAANLHRLAQEVVKRHGGRLPQDAETLRQLPGVGAYTAGAVAAFAYEKREPAVDTNVERVMRRVFFGDGRKGGKAIRRDEGRYGGKAVRRKEAARPGTFPTALPAYRPTAPGPAAISALVRRILPQRGATVWEFNQALMDLGATICTARVARCGVCPVRGVCKSGQSG